MPSELSYAQRAHRYAVAVVAGEIPACRWIVLACQRQLDDLERSAADDPEFPYWFDAERVGSRVCRFIERLPHTKGKWAGRKELIRLEDWQCFFLVVAFGWVHKETGLRRFRRVVLFVPRKNAKSTKAAGISLYGLTADGYYPSRDSDEFIREHGAEVYCGATTERQAFEVFRPAWLMAQRTPELRKRFELELGGSEKNPGTIYSRQSASRFEVLIGNPGDGASPSVSVTDEYHEHETSDQVDTMRTGMMAREQPMAVIISTAGTNIEGPCYDLWTELEKVLERVLVDEQLFGLIFTIDVKVGDRPGDDWTKPEALQKANPNYGVSVIAESVLAQQREAINSVRKQGTFKCKHLNVWGQAGHAWMNMEWWRACANEDLTWEMCREWPSVLALDGSLKLDFTCAVWVFFDGGRYRLKARHYLPEATAQDSTKQRYQEWATGGRIIQTDGVEIDFLRVEEELAEQILEAPPREVTYDNTYLVQLAQGLERRTGITRVDMPMGTWRSFSAAMRDMEAAAKAGRLEHDGDPVLTWMISNVVAKEDTRGNVYPRKQRADNKIDGAVAAIIGWQRTLNQEEDLSTAMGYML